MYSSSIDYILFLSGGCLLIIIGWLYFSRKLHFSNVPLLLLFLFLVYIFVNTSNILIFFMCYEFFLLPSFFLIFVLSPNRRGIISSIYFLMWTQVGSFIVFLSIIYLTTYSNTFNFNFNFSTGWVIFFFFIGFGIKIPV